MPARRKSLATLQLSGSTKAHPGRYKDRTNLEPCPSGIGLPPSHVSLARKRIWAEIVQSLPEGHLQSADRALLEVVTFLMSRMRNRRVSVTKGEITLLINALSKLGLTPTDRQRVVIPVKPKANVYSAWDDL